MVGFLQTPPRLADAWTSDSTLRGAVEFYLGAELFARAETELAVMGKVATAPETIALAARAESQPPVHVPYSAWGQRVDEVRVSDAYLELGRIGVRAGVTALPYEESVFGDRTRIVWAAILSLWGPSSALYSCPVAMTDGAARTLLDHGSVEDVEIVGRLTSRDPDYAWTSGQWMTETTGGSDVGRSETVAVRDEDGIWRLHGTKWFTSAITADIALTLARPEGAPAGSRGLGLFRVHRLLPDGERNAIVVRRLKDKLGTRALPTAELELEGAVANPVGDPLDGGGLRRMASMLNITRIHNSIGAAGALGRGLAWARAYAEVREAFGSTLDRLPLHRTTLAELAVDYAAAVELCLRTSQLLGRVEHSTATPDERLIFRALTPVTKLATARWAVAGVAEAMEAVGGVGYCEDSMLPSLVRNTHVLPIWEGTTNVLSLDLVRAGRSGAIGALLEDVRHSAAPAADSADLAPIAGEVIKAADLLAAAAAEFEADPDSAQAAARGFALGVANTYACACLLKRAAVAGGVESRPALAAARLASRGLIPPGPAADPSLASDGPRGSPEDGN